LELGLGMPIAKFATKWGGPAISMAEGVEQPKQAIAIGPRYLASGKWANLADMALMTSQLKLIRESPEEVEFEVHYSNEGKTEVWEHYRLSKGKLKIHTRAEESRRPVKGIRFAVPLLVTDGMSKSEIAESDGKATVSYLGATYAVAFDEDVKHTMEANEYGNRNGVYRTLMLEREGSEIAVELTLDKREGPSK
jgi:hypothetical protein